jgi:methylmalonyl-CoA mutase N-terminal domain/subunit
VLAHEVGMTRTADPLGGSYYVEALTTELELRAWELIEQIDERGGAVAAVEQGFIQGEIEASAYAWTAAVESGERAVIGVNTFVEEGAPPIELHQIDADGERRQIERTRVIRAGRDAASAEHALGEVREAARGTANLLPPMRAALAARCTVGEVCGVLRDEWGTYDGRARQ